MPSGPGEACDPDQLHFPRFMRRVKGRLRRRPSARPRPGRWPFVAKLRMKLVPAVQRLLPPGLLVASLLVTAVPAPLSGADTCLTPSFTLPAGLVPVQTQPSGIVLGDWNRDGKLDFAVTNSVSNTVSLRFGDGAGGFPGLATVASARTLPHGIAARAFTDDGSPDL